MFYKNPSLTTDMVNLIYVYTKYCRIWVKKLHLLAVFSSINTLTTNLKAPAVHSTVFT
jgi:hypothetical protein